MDAMRAMLDELMGKDRNVVPSQRTNTKMRYDDPTICKYALAGLCPYGLFRNTRSDLGGCGVDCRLCSFGQAAWVAGDRLQAAPLLALLPGHCGFEVHEENLAYEQAKADYDQQDPREHER
jgi:RNA-binding protein Luc7-like 2